MEPMPGACDGGKDVAKILVHIDVLTKAYNIRGHVERSGEQWCRVHNNFHAHAWGNVEGWRL
jgi:hypothetical protein